MGGHLFHHTGDVSFGEDGLFLWFGRLLSSAATSTSSAMEFIAAGRPYDSDRAKVAALGQAADCRGSSAARAQQIQRQDVRRRGSTVLLRYQKQACVNGPRVSSKHQRI